MLLRQRLVLAAVLIGAPPVLAGTLFDDLSKEEAPQRQADMPSLQVPETKEPATAQERVVAFFGHYGYFITIPEGYTMLPSFVDKEKTVEFVPIVPVALIERDKERVADYLLRRDLYGQYDIILLEVFPRRHKAFGGEVTSLAEIRARLTSGLEKDHAKYQLKDVSLSRPAFELTTYDPSVLIQTIVEGEKVIYVFTAGKDEYVYRHIRESLTEMAPHDRPGL